MPPPNIVFLHVDQLHHKAISAYGCPHVRTPSIDRLVAEGTSFMESTTPMPQCCPARASWFTGRMSKEHGVVVNDVCPMDPTIPDLGTWLREKAGYDCVYVGKWHVTGRDVTRSFRLLHPGHGYGELGDSDVARVACSFLREPWPERPFFLSIGLLNPHDCCYTAGANGGIGKFPLAANMLDELPPLPDNFDYDYASRQDLRVAEWSLLDWRYYRYVYYRMVEMVDREVGRIYQAVRGSPNADNTLLVFTSDHGDGLAFHANIQKGYMLEEAWRVPAVVCWPGRIEAGRRDCEHLVSGVDLAPTIVDYAGAPPMPNMSVARSWRPLLEGGGSGPRGWRDYVVGETSVGRMAIAIRDARMKTILYEDSVQLYNIANDPLEMRDLAREPGAEEHLARHRRYLAEYLDSIAVFRPPPGHAGAAAVARFYDPCASWYKRLREEVSG